MDDQTISVTDLAQQLHKAVQAVSTRRVEKYAVPGAFRVFRNAVDEVVVEVFQ